MISYNSIYKTSQPCQYSLSEYTQLCIIVVLFVFPVETHKKCYVIMWNIVSPDVCFIFTLAYVCFKDKMKDFADC